MLREERGEKWPLRIVEVEGVGQERIALDDAGRVQTPTGYETSIARRHE